MLRCFNLLLKLYPPDFRAEFGDEMRAVFLSLAESRGRRSSFLWNEYGGLLRGAAWERCRQFQALAPALAGGAVFASGMQLLMYWYLLPGKGKNLARALEQLASRLLMLCLLVGIAAGQQARQDPATLELAKSIYSSSLTALRQAKTMDDLRKVSDDLDAPEWISVDRFGRTILTKKEADRDLESLLALPPDRRVAGMDIIWAERDSERMIVLAWMMPNQAERVDAEGEFGAKGATHQVSRGTLIRDIFVSTPNGWRRIRHDKLVPNDIVLTVDGVPRILPPADERHHVTPGR